MFVPGVSIPITTRASSFDVGAEARLPAVAKPCFILPMDGRPLGTVAGFTDVENLAYGAARVGTAGLHTCSREPGGGPLAYHTIDALGSGAPMVTVLVLLLFSLVLLLSEDTGRRPSTPHPPS